MSDPSAIAEPVGGYPRPLTAWAGVAVLFVVYASSFIDRQISSLLVAPIRSDLAISDTGFSLLHGFAFSLFYVVLGGPIGQLVDRADRRRVLCAGIAAWSLFTCLCGRAQSFTALFLARMGVGVGEASVAPATYSLIADYFPPARRGLPMGVFGAGVYVGIGTALVVGGLMVRSLQAIGPVDIPFLGHVVPWQLAFLIAGLPGLPLCLLVLFIAEPRRAGAGKAMVATLPKGALRRHWQTNGAAIAYHHGATACLAMALYALLAWAPEHARRTYGVGTGAAAPAIGGLVLLFGTGGVILAGWVSDRLLARGLSAARSQVMALAALAAIPCTILFASAPTMTLCFVGLGGSLSCLATLTACGPAGVQELNPPELRGVGAALFQFVVTLTGLGTGPTIVAILSDRLDPSGAHLHQALGLLLPIFCLLAACLAWMGRGSYARVVAGLHAPPDRLQPPAPAGETALHDMA